MYQRTIAGQAVHPIGLGCMNLCHGYGDQVSDAEGIALLQQAYDWGANHFDTATLYGGGRSETLVGQALAGGRRAQVFLASKAGMAMVDGKRVIDGRPSTLKAQCDASLQRLQTDVIDLYYLHRLDPTVPVEDSVGALADLVDAGKIRYVGLSEVSAATIRRAHQVHPIAAVQNEYSLWTRNPEYGSLAACTDVGAQLVAFSPVARGFLSNTLATDAAQFKSNDLRRNMPRFQGSNYTHNTALLADYVELAQQAGCTPAQLALVWLLAQNPAVVPIPGTTQIAHLKDNLAAAALTVDAHIIQQAGEIINHQTVLGHRYPEASRQDVDTEEPIF